MVQLDMIAAFLGRPSNKALIKSAGHMSRSADPRAPIEASPEELKKIKTDPRLLQLMEFRDKTKELAKAESGTLKKRYTDRIRPFCTRYRARDHVHSHHLRGLDDCLIIYPHPNCKRAGIKLHRTDAIKSHLTRQHDYGIFNTYKGGAPPSYI